MLNKQEAAKLAFSRQSFYKQPLAVYVFVSPYTDYNQLVEETGYQADLESDFGKFVDKAIRHYVSEKMTNDNDEDVVIEFTEEAYEKDLMHHLTGVEALLSQFAIAHPVFRMMNTEEVFERLHNQVMAINYLLYVLEDSNFNSTVIEETDMVEVMKSFGLLSFDFLRSVFDSRGMDTSLFDLFELKEDDDDNVDIHITDDEDKVNAYVERHGQQEVQTKMNDIQGLLQENGD